MALEYWVSRRQVEAADVIVFCRNIEPRHKNALAVAKELGKPIIYDLDDNLFMSLSGSRLGSRPSTEQTNQLVEYLESASLVRVYSEILRRRVVQINPNTVLMNGPLDWGCIPNRSIRREAHEKVKIIYATSRISDELVNVFLEDVEQLLITHSGRVELYLWGVYCDRLADYSTVRFLKHITDYDRYFRKLADFGFDIGLAPLLDDEFHLSKTNIKFREYAACRIAGIYSDVKVYADSVSHEKTGLLVPNEKGEWYKALSRLVDDVELRTRIQEQAFQYVRQHYSQDEFCAIWLEQIRAVLAKKNLMSTIPLTPRGLSSRSAEELLSFTQIVKFVFRLIWRFVYNLRTRGVRQAFGMARWILNDLTILFWRK